MSREHNDQTDAQKLRESLIALRNSDEWPKIKATMEAENERFVALGDGDDSYDRILIELAKATMNGTDAIENWPPEKIRHWTDVVLRVRNTTVTPMTLMGKTQVCRSVEDSDGESPDRKMFNYWQTKDINQATFPLCFKKQGKREFFDSNTVFAWIETNTKYRRKASRK